MAKLKVLISEDNIHKYKMVEQVVFNFLADQEDINFDIVRFEAMNPTMLELSTNGKDYQILIQDMNLPRYQDGSCMESKGGAEILNRLKYMGVKIYSIVCSSNPKNQTIDILKEYKNLKNFDEKNIIEFDNSSFDWKKDLIKALEDILEKIENNEF